MSEPLMLGTISSATKGFFPGFSQHFKPSRSPYLLSGLLAVLCLLGIAGILQANKVFFFGFFLLATVLTFLSVLCFFFKPYKPATSLLNTPRRKKTPKSRKKTRTSNSSSHALFVLVSASFCLPICFFRCPALPLRRISLHPSTATAAHTDWSFLCIVYFGPRGGAHLIIFGVYTYI